MFVSFIKKYKKTGDEKANIWFRHTQGTGTNEVWARGPRALVLSTTVAKSEPFDIDYMIHVYLEASAEGVITQFVVVD